jgi:peptide/nickel transport system permease protein
LAEVWKRLCKNAVAIVALVIVLLLCFVAIFADVIVNYENEAIKSVPSQRLRPPSVNHIFGTDGMGRDIFARIVHGSRISLQIGIYSTFLSVLGGIVLGSLAGYYGGFIDNIIMRVSDVFMSVPALLLALAIVAALGQGVFNLIVALSVTQIPAFARLMRSQIITIRENDFIESAHAIGTSDFRIIYLHILPNTIGPIIVQATVSIAMAIIAAAGLSYIGLGVPPPAPEWGTMLAEGREYMRQHIHMILIPGLAIVLSALSFNLLGDGLRDALDPRLKGNR